MTTVAFIGLGIMGGPMAGHLVDAGYDVIGYNRSTREGRARWSSAGGRGADSIAEAVRDADVVAVMVPGLPDVQEVLAGDGGVFDNAKPGTLVIDFSSIRPDVTAELAEQAKEQGLPDPRRPGLRRRGGREGTPRCRSWSAATAADFDAASRVLDAVGKTIVHVGPSGAGPDRQGRQPAHRRRQHPAARRGGRLPRGVRRRHRGRARGPRRRAGRQQGARPEGREHARPARSSPASGSTCTTRTWASSPSAAREAGVVIPLGAVVAQLMASAAANGDGGLDHSALLRGVLRLSGRTRQRRRPDSIRPPDRSIRHGTHACRRRRRRHPGEGRRRHRLRPARARRSTRSTRRCATTAASTTSSPATSRAPRTWPRATPAPRPATSASASAPPARPAPT